jgi:transposase InsO family protein
VKAGVKYMAIYRHKGKYSVCAMCAFFEVSRSGYYDFVKRMNMPDKDEGLANAIAECQNVCRKTYGYRRVHIWLEREYGFIMDPKTVLRVMNKYGLLSEIRRRRKYMQMGQQIHKYENLLNRNFHADSPNQKWVTDISYIHTTEGILYLSAIRDLFDNSIVAYKTAIRQTISLVADTIREAKAKEAVTTELQLHSDQGFQYTSHAYHNLTKEYGITPSMSRRGNCYDNAMAENFFGILKSECINRQKIKDFAVAKSLIDDYIHFYNHQRIQFKTKLTPLEKRRQSQ